MQGNSVRSHDNYWLCVTKNILYNGLGISLTSSLVIADSSIMRLCWINALPEYYPIPAEEAEGSGGGEARISLC